MAGRLRHRGTAAPTPAVVDEVGTDLLRRWREPHRHYHDATHLAEVLAGRRHALRRGAGVGGRRNGAVASLATGSTTPCTPSSPPDANEAESAALASRAARPAWARRRRAERRGSRPSCSTRRPRTARRRPPRTAAAGRRARRRPVGARRRPVARFDEYCTQVREEYAHVPVAPYARARSEVLRPFLVRDHVYRTDARPDGVGAGRPREPRARAHPPRGLSVAATSAHQNCSEHSASSSAHVTHRRSRGVVELGGARAGRRPGTRTCVDLQQVAALLPQAARRAVVEPLVARVARGDSAVDDEPGLLADLANSVLAHRLPRLAPPAGRPPLAAPDGEDDGEVAGVVLHEGHRREHPGLVGLAVGPDQVDVGRRAVDEADAAHPGHTLVAAALLHPQPAGLQRPEQLSGRRRPGARRRRRPRSAPRGCRSGRPRSHARGCRPSARSGAARRGWCR